MPSESRVRCETTAADRFRASWVWRHRGDELALDLTRMAGQGIVLYAFVQGGAVIYVGKTTGTLETRMGDYHR